MFNAWFGSKSSRHSQPRPDPRPAPDNVLSDASLSQSTAGTPGNLTSLSDVPLEEVHTHINDPGVYAPTPSLIHSAEKEAATLGTSDVPAAGQDATSTQRTLPDRPGGTLFTPQDVMIAQVFGRPAPPATDPAHATSNASALSTSDSLPLAPSPQTPPPSNAQPGPTLSIYDPFSGAKLGERLPVSPSATAPGEHSPLAGMDDRRLWSNLERILELQAEIAAMHADMEGVGGRASGNTHAGDGGNVGPRKRMRRDQTLLVGDEEPEEHEPEGGGMRGPAVFEISTDQSDVEDEDEDEGIGFHGYGKKRRDEEFSKLAEQFAQRKAAIGGIMNKLDDLTMALKAFHALPPPRLDLAMSPSRTDTMSSAPSIVSATSSPHPIHEHHGQLSSSLSSISPSQAVSPVPPVASLSPPVPPISTLAPAKFATDASLPSGSGPVVAPILPRTAVARIIPGAPDVDSPSDMEIAQSVLRGVP